VAGDAGAVEACGILEYSIFRRDELLVFTMRIEDDFDAVWDRIEVDPVNARWQKAMSTYFLPAQETRAGNGFRLCRRCFIYRNRSELTRLTND
jgi:L-rhamnose mutarotase